MSEEKKLPWVETVPGVHPAFKDLTPTEQEIQDLAKSMGRAYMSASQKLLDGAMREVECIFGNMELYKSQGRKNMLWTCYEPLARAYLKLGRFTEAMDILAKNNRALPSCRKLMNEIVAIKEAIEKDDAAQCPCERQTETIKDAAGKDVTIALNRRYAWGEVWSEKHKQVVTMWICSICKDANAHNNIPERQQFIHESRVALSHITSPHQVIPAHLSDAALLKI